MEAFEASLSRVTGGHPTVAVNSGTAALHCAYAAAGLGRGTTLVTTPLTFVATAAMAIHLGADVVFADIDEETLCIDPDSVEKVLTKTTQVISGVDYGGNPCDWPALRDIADNAGAVLIDDAAHAIGTKLHGRAIGDWADLTTFSFHPVKTITTAEGGAITVRRHEFLEPVRRFRNHGLVRQPMDLDWPDEGPWHQEVQGLAFNYRMPDINAALGVSQMTKLDRFIQRRRELVRRYHMTLGGITGLRLQGVMPGADPAWHLFVVRLPPDRRRLAFERLRHANVGVQVHYLPVHRQPAFRALGYRPGTCPVAESVYREIISLPLHPGMSDDQQDHVVSALKRALA